MWRTVSELWSLRLTRACGVCCRADCIAQWCLSFASCKRVGLGLVSLKTVRWAFFCAFFTQLCHNLFFAHNCHTHHLSLQHTIFHIQLCHTQLFTHNFFTSRSSTASFVFPSFPVPATTFVAHYWKKLTCGVIRSFDYICTNFVEMYIHVLHSGYEFMNPMNACVCLLNTLATMGFWWALLERLRWKCQGQGAKLSGECHHACDSH